MYTYSNVMIKIYVLGRISTEAVSVNVKVAMSLVLRCGSTEHLRRSSRPVLVSASLGARIITSTAATAHLLPLTCRRVDYERGTLA